MKFLSKRGYNGRIQALAAKYNLSYDDMQKLSELVIDNENKNSLLDGYEETEDEYVEYEKPDILKEWKEKVESLTNEINENKLKLNEWEEKYKELEDKYRERFASADEEKSYDKDDEEIKEETIEDILYKKEED